MESSTLKGTHLENQIYDLLKKLIKTDNFIVPSKSSEVFKKKGYYSLKREKEIIFDVTIEVTLPHADKYSNLFIFECKNLNKQVTVDDVEEFGSKLNQIGEHNTKGIIVTTIGFQESALKVAKAEGMGLIRLTSNKNIQWISYRKNSILKSLPESDYEFIDSNFNEEPFVCCINNHRITNLADLLLELSVIDVFIDSEEFIEIPFIKHERFNYIVNKLMRNNVYEGTVLNLEKLAKFLEPLYNVKFKYNSIEQDNILGKIEFNPLCIKISEKAGIDKHRLRFTIAHEIGHLILHSNILKDRIDLKSDNENSLALKYSSLKKNSEILEIQANLFASYLLVPEILLVSVMNSIFIEYRIPKKILFLDSQPVNQKQVNEILYKLSSMFQVSVESIKIRLLKLNLLIDKTDYKLGTLIREYFK